MAVLVHLVDEEQGQHLDAPAHVAQLFIQMGLDGAADLGLFHHILVDVPDGLAQRHLLGVAELDVLIARGAVDAGHGVALIQLPPAGQQKQVIPRLYRHRFPGHSAGFALYVHLHFGPEALLVEHRQQAHIGLIKAPGHLVGGHGDLLHQPHLIGVHRGQTVEQIDLLPVGGRVAQHTQRIQRRDGLFGLGGVVYALGLVDDDDGVCVPDKAHGRLAVQLVLGLVDDVLRLFEGVDVDDHHLDVGAGGKLAHVGQLGGVVDEIPAGHAVVLQGKVLLRDLEGLVHALPDGHRRHYHDELGEAVPPVQLEDGLGVDVGFPGARLHLHAELPGGGAVRHGQKVPLLDGAHIGGECLVGQPQDVAHPQLRRAEAGLIRELALIHDGEGGAAALLPGEQAGHGLHGGGLEILILEFQFHGGLRLSIQNIDRQQRPLAIAFLRVLSL